ncbi:AAA family ATPase [Bacillus sp. JJ1122]|uniref:chloramphenicol phosphotransferase CPT family protein n=1 Tax=Bacillus sp. JJ1122 TaxID=3122951 RepID=UPI002FFF3121
MNKGKIILLNGVSSFGKSSLSNELVKLLPEFFHFSIDDFDTIIERMEDREYERLIPVPTEHFFHRNLAMFSEKGVNLIVDHILHDEDTFKDCIAILEHYPVFFVGVHCPADELKRREIARGNRTIGQAVRQLDFVHQQKEVYDVEVDTFQMSLQSAAKVIAVKLDEMKAPAGWSNTVENFKQTNLS